MSGNAKTWGDGSWRTKPTDRFVLRWIKVHLSARISPRLVSVPWMRPWMITVSASALGVVAGVVFALGSGWIAGCIAAVGQVLDGVDGQFARLTGRQSARGAFTDSVLDRYADGAMVIGATVYLLRLPPSLPAWVLLLLGSLALIGGNLISYSTARAENLSIDTGPPTLASKGTRTAALILGAWGSALWPAMPLLSIFYLAVHANAVVLRRIVRAHRGT
jgi:phosphatidylglycerophosphate synthase